MNYIVNKNNTETALKYIYKETLKGFRKASPEDQGKTMKVVPCHCRLQCKGGNPVLIVQGSSIWFQEISHFPLQTNKMQTIIQYMAGLPKPVRSFRRVTGFSGRGKETIGPLQNLPSAHPFLSTI